MLLGHGPHLSIRDLGQGLQTCYEGSKSKYLRLCRLYVTSCPRCYHTKAYTDAWNEWEGLLYEILLTTQAMGSIWPLVSLADPWSRSRPTQAG